MTDGRSRCMGGSRGGLTTKIHAMVDANGLPVSLVLSEGQAYDGHSAHLMLDTLMPGTVLLADRTYDADKLRAAIADKGAFANIWCSGSGMGWCPARAHHSS